MPRFLHPPLTPEQRTRQSLGRRRPTLESVEHEQAWAPSVEGSANFSGLYEKVTYSKRILTKVD